MPQQITFFNRTEKSIVVEIRNTGPTISFTLNAYQFNELSILHKTIDILITSGKETVFFASSVPVQNSQLFEITLEAFSFHVSQFSDYRKKPVYLISHKCNSPQEMEESVSKGANAIEADIWIDDNNSCWISHDNKKELSVDEWILKGFGQQPSKPHLLMFDIKEAPEVNSLQQKVKDYQSTLPEYILYSTANKSNADFFQSIAYSVSSKEAFCIDEEEEMSDALQKFMDIGIKKAWFGNGIFSLAPDLVKFRENLYKASKIRDSGLSPLKKTMAWTISSEETLLQYLYGCDTDAIIAEKDDLSSFRKKIEESPVIKMADENDDPFQLFLKNNGKLLTNMITL